MPRASKTVAASRKPAGGTGTGGVGKAKPAPVTSASAPAPKATRRAAASRNSSTSSTSSASSASSTPAEASAPPAAARKAGARKAGARKAAATGPVVDKFLQEQHSLLLAERATYVQQAESLRAEADQLAEEMEPGDIQFDEESGEGGTLNVERERDLALSAQARLAVEEIDKSLAKIEAGTYGICEGCGEPIKRARLKALPYASLCVACKSGGLSRR